MSKSKKPTNKDSKQAILKKILQQSALQATPQQTPPQGAIQPSV
jgi:hypothetical protein